MGRHDATSVSGLGTCRRVPSNAFQFAVFGVVSPVKSKLGGTLMNLHAAAEGGIRPSQGCFIANRWRPAVSGRTLPVVAPAEGRAFAEIAAGSAADIDAAVEAARHALDHGAWGRLTATERGRLLTRLSYAIADHAEELARLEARDTGKPMKQARADIVAAARYFEFYGGAADKVHGETIPFLQGFFVATEREPHGVTAQIIPWNYPAQMFGRSVAAALAMGNACVVKPAEDACLTPLRLAELGAEVGFPDGAVNVVPGLGEEAGAALAGHRGIDFISFTGSPEVGTLIQAAAAKPHRLYAGTRRQVATRGLCRRRPRCRDPHHRHHHGAERRADVFGGVTAPGRTQAL